MVTWPPKAAACWIFMKLGSNTPEWLLLRLQIMTYLEHYVGAGEVSKTEKIIAKTEKIPEKKCFWTTPLRAHGVGLILLMAFLPMAYAKFIGEVICSQSLKLCSLGILKILESFINWLRTAFFLRFPLLLFQAAASKVIRHVKKTLKWSLDEKGSVLHGYPIP